MENLLMCRICLAENLSLREVVGTYLQEMYQLLTNIPLDTRDFRPTEICYICWARLKNCYELRKDSLRSEQLFAQMLISNVQTPSQLGVAPSTSRLSIKQTTLLSMRPLPQYDTDCDIKLELPEAYDASEVKLEHEVIVETPLGEDSLQTDIWCDVDSDTTLADVKKEMDHIISAQDAKKPRLVPQRHHDDLTSGKLKMNDKIKDKQRIDKNSTVEDQLEDKGNMVVEVCDEVETQILHTYKSNKITANNAVNEITGQRSIENYTSKKLKPYLCSTCRKCFSTISYLINHTCTHTGEKPYECNVCKKPFRHKNHSVDLIRTNTGEKPYESNVCKKCLPKKGALNKHIHKHSGEKRYECYICKKYFSQKCHLDNHIRIHIDEKPYKCSVCNRCFRQKTGLDCHIRIHTGQKPYKCNECKKCYRHKMSLNDHIRTHTGEKPYLCDVCRKCFSRKDHLVRHIRTHTGEKPYMCHVCKKCFVQKNVLDSHIRTHTGEKPYMCDVCKKVFNQKGHLDRHNLIHTGEKPYKCNVCKKRFNAKSNLMKHIRTHTGEKPYMCHVCNKPFRRSHHLVKHIRTQHISGDKPS